MKNVFAVSPTPVLWKISRLTLLWKIEITKCFLSRKAISHWQIGRFSNIRTLIDNKFLITYFQWHTKNRWKIEKRSTRGKKHHKDYISNKNRSVKKVTLMWHLFSMRTMRSRFFNVKKLLFDIWHHNFHGMFNLRSKFRGNSIYFETQRNQYDFFLIFYDGFYDNQISHFSHIFNDYLVDSITR